MTLAARSMALGLCALLGAASCARERPHVVSPAEARALRVFVSDEAILEGGADACAAFYPELREGLPVAIQRGLVEAGFSIVTDAAAERDLTTKVRAQFSDCRAQGTCIRGITDVELVGQDGSTLVERIRFDNRDTPCELSPAVSELPDAVGDEIAERVVESGRVSDLAKWRLSGAPPRAVAVAAPAPPPPVTEGPVPAPSSPAMALPAFAEGASQPNAFALIVGIEAYRDLPPPTGARGDAEAFARLAERTLGVPRQNIQLLLDDRATRGDIEKALRWLELNVPAGARIYFFYSGHGAPDPVSGTPYVLPYDGDPRALDQTALPLARVAGHIGSTQAHDAIAFLDACFTGSGGRSVLPAGVRPLVRVKAEPPPRGLAVLASSGETEISGASAEGMGLFTKHLLEGLGRRAGDLDADGSITLTELHQFVAPRVKAEALRDHRAQTPTLVLPEGFDASRLVVTGKVAP